MSRTNPRAVHWVSAPSMLTLVILYLALIAVPVTAGLFDETPT